MSSRRKQGERVQKKSYVKPEVKQVQLKPEEAVLGIGCKTSGGGAGSGGTCNQGLCVMWGS